MSKISKPIVDLRLSNEEPADLKYSMEFYMGQPLPQWYNPKKPFAFLGSLSFATKDRKKQNTISLKVLKKWIQK